MIEVSCRFTDVLKSENLRLWLIYDEEIDITNCKFCIVRITDRQVLFYVLKYAWGLCQ